ncbi:phosphatase PAP2 family protein [Mycolicibacterium sp. S2-37]|uniref:phosphatase PAP2 family protein n=1 Tax=Mycolicibacterium sp. S2-37 TaxID=2810297 RepID=UPI001A93C922|nr:phosphatase PAP2 family protein [Mycolicibacterium sp. S2-37]MBO0681260.1 phosphatase PAP2 family protein [Mycolicibacterium sp. S2-37]
MTARRTWLAGSALAAVAVFAVMWSGYVLRWSWLAGVDAAALEPMYRLGAAHPAWVAAWDVYCTVFSPVTFRVVGLVVIAVALIRRRPRLAVFVAITVEFSGALTQLCKEIVDRPRPDTAFVAADSTAFPSGHALGLLVCVGAYLVIGLPLLRRACRGWAIAVGVVVVVTIGAGRVVLNVHHPSDVVAGWALGYAYFVACWLLYPLNPAVGKPVAPDTAR